MLAALLSVAAAGTVGQTGAVQPGIDVWKARDFVPLAGRRIGLITNLTGRDAAGRLTAEALAESDAVELVALFSPEHGFDAVVEGAVGDATHGASGLPIYSLYGETRRPTDAMLDGLDGLVFDIQDIGTRFYTYATTLAYSMQEAARRGIPIVVLDRPNPIGGTAFGGPVLDPEQRSFVGWGQIPIRHGMTLGELALLFNAEEPIGAALTVIPMTGWRRGMAFDATGLVWVDPSPNMRNLTQAYLYPAVGPLETTNVSVGRGTDAPFEWFGAPWIEPRRLSAALNDAALPGVRFVPRRLTPAASTHANLDCGGVNLVLVDRDAYDAGRTAATLALTLAKMYPDDWDRSRLVRLWGDPAIDGQLDAGRSVDEIVASWADDLARFARTRDQYLLYD